MNRTLMGLALATVVLATGTASAAATDAARYRNGFGHVQYSQYNERQAERVTAVDEREARLERRIRRGQSDGGITQWEARRLQRELESIRQKEQAYRADGRLDRREFAELSAELDRLSEHVREQRWDDQRRW